MTLSEAESTENSPIEFSDAIESIEATMEEEDDEFYDIIDETQFISETQNHSKFTPSVPSPPSPPLRHNKRLTILEFLQEEPEEEEEEKEEEVAVSKNENKRETFYEFLNNLEDENGEDDENGEGDEDDEDDSEASSLSRLQKELETEGISSEQHNREHQEIIESDRKKVLNLPHHPQLDPQTSTPNPRRTNSLLLRRANPLATFFTDQIDSDSDSMISELTETLTVRTDFTAEEARFSRIPSMLAQPNEYLKLAKRYKPVPVKTKSKQRSEFSSLFLIQELKRSNTTNITSDTGNTGNIGNIDQIHRSSSVYSNASSKSSQPASDSSKAIFSLTFSPDGHFLAAAGAEGIIKIWSILQVLDTSTTSTTSTPTPSIPRVATIFESEPIQILKGHTAEILDCAWSSNNFLLTASMDKTVRLWHHSRPDTLGIFQHLDYVTSVAFHPRDPRIFISGSLDCKLRLWSIQNRTIIHWNQLPPGNFITAVAFTRSGNTVIAGTSGGTALIFDTENLRYNTQILVRSSRSKSVGKKITSITPVPGQFENDERIVISSNDSRIRMYSLRDKNVIYKYKGHENVSSQIGASLSTDGEYVLSGSEDCRVYIWRSDGKFEKKGLFSSFRKDHICSFESFKAHSNPVTAAIIAPNCLTNLLQSLQLRPLNPLQSAEGKIIITADVTGQIKVFENNSKLIEWLK